MKKILSDMNKMYIGDPSFVMKDEYYNEWMGKYKGQNGVTKIKGKYFVAHNTEFGNGIYVGSDNVEYTVESEYIAVVPWELVDINKDYHNTGKIIFTKQIDSFSYKDGDFIIDYEDDIAKHEIVISTAIDTSLDINLDENDIEDELLDEGF